ncbi:MAG: TIGR01777 family protein [Paludibacter sp. 47-17]|nr:MAG: TIGR01777 family protein [Paludibacter sp. SCN 50-10]OJX88420.1 MAG: TIGR01777 family protein [Paludibacter sp. 47-17]
MSSVLLTGSTGLVGKSLVRVLKDAGFSVRRLTTRRELAVQEGYFLWNPAAKEADDRAFEGVEYIIHLAGSSIGNGRWTARRKKDILESRTLTAELLLAKVSQLQLPLKAFVSASATGYYGSATTETIYDEYSPAGRDFLADVCVQWEKAADRFQSAGIRTVKMRTGVVLAKGAPALEKMLLPIKSGLGGPLGNGRQYMPWIHLDDLCRLYLRAICDESMSGAWNAVAPEHITNRELMRTLARKLGKPFLFPPVPAFMLRLLLGEMAVIVTDGSRVSSRRLKATGFEFKVATLDDIEV